MGDTNRKTDTPTETATGSTGSDATQTVVVDGEPVTIDDQTTVTELKDLVGAPDDDIATYRGENDLHALNDDDVVANHVEDGQTMSFQPAGRKDLFGHTLITNPASHG